jgi:hypothetical protein
MAFNPIAILTNATDDPDVAKNHHLHVVPSVLENIEEHDKVARLIKDANGGVESDDSKLMSDSADEMRKVVEGFYAKWPAPVIENIEDVFDIQDEIPTAYWGLTLMHSRPLIPLVALNDPKTSATIFYKDDLTGAVFKVPNIWYNQPNRARSIRWSF